MSRVKTQLIIEGQNKAGKAINEVEGQLGRLSGTAKAAGAALLATFSVGAIAGWVKESANAMVNLERMSRLSGSTAADFSAWAHASKSVGIEQEKLGDIFKDVQDKVGDFLQTGGGGMADFFENVAPLVGVTAEQFRNLSGPEALQLYVSSLEKANLSHSEMTFYLEAIASDSALLLPLLQNNAEGFRELAEQAEKFGLVMSAEDAANAREFAASMQTMQAATDGAGRQIASELLPTLNAVSGALQDTSARGEYAARIAQVLALGLKVLATAGIIVGDAFGAVGRFIGGAAAAAMAAARGQFREAADIMRAVGEDNARNTKEAAERIKGLWDGTLEQQGKAAADVQKKWQDANENMVRSAKESSEQIKSAYKGIATEAKQRISELQAAERKANQDIEKIRASRLDIEKRYAKAFATLAGGAGAADPSWNNIQALQLAAQRALAEKDFELAQEQAQAALQMILDLQAAGGNTYGLEGVAQGLLAIEREANDLAESEADAKLKSISVELESLKKLADIEVTADLSPAEIAKVTAQIKALAEALGKEFVITPTIVMPNTEGAEPVRRANGGLVTGPGTSTSDSIPALLSNGEYVIRAAAVRQLGTGFLDAVNRGLPMRLASGGLAGVAAGLASGPQYQNMGSLDIRLGGESPVTVYGKPDALQALHRAARKLGRTHR